MNHRLAFMASLGLAAAAGCGISVEAATFGSTSGSSSSGSSSSSGDATSTGTGGSVPADVTGKSSINHIGDSASVDDPIDLSGAVIQALLPDGQGGWKTIPGFGNTDGTFVIPNVPVGPYLLRVQNDYIHTSARVIDFGYDETGRGDAVVSAVSPTPIVNHLENLSPWDPNDYLEWFTSNNDGYANSYGATSFMTGPPAMGGTSLDGQAVDWVGEGLIDHAKGDVLRVDQLSMQTTPGGAYYYTLTRVASFDSLAQADGQPLALNGTFASVTADQTVSFDLQSPAFDALQTSVSTKAGAGFGVVVEIATAPGAGAHGSIGNAASLFYLGVAGQTPAKIDNVAYGNPYPAAWGSFAIAYTGFPVSFVAPGAQQADAEYGFIYVGLDPKKLSQGPIAPVLGPVQKPMINGQSAFGPLSGITATPTLSWSPPALGTPTRYEIIVYALTSSAGVSTSTYTALLMTSDTSISVPPGVLQAGSTYWFRITALQSQTDLASSPFRLSVDFASADVLTTAATP